MFNHYSEWPPEPTVEMVEESFACPQERPLWIALGIVSVLLILVAVVFG